MERKLFEFSQISYFEHIETLSSIQKNPFCILFKYVNHLGLVQVSLFCFGLGLFDWLVGSFGGVGCLLWSRFFCLFICLFSYFLEDWPTAENLLAKDLHTLKQGVFRFAAYQGLGWSFGAPGRSALGRFSFAVTRGGSPGSHQRHSASSCTHIPVEGPSLQGKVHLLCFLKKAIILS